MWHYMYKCYSIRVFFFCLWLFSSRMYLIVYKTFHSLAYCLLFEGFFSVVLRRACVVPVQYHPYLFYVVCLTKNTMLSHYTTNSIVLMMVLELEGFSVVCLPNYACLLLAILYTLMILCHCTHSQEKTRNVSTNVTTCQLMGNTKDHTQNNWTPPTSIIHSYKRR